MRTWRIRTFAVPAEPIAALLALTFALGAIGAAPAAAAAAARPPAAERPTESVSGGHLPRRSAVARPVGSFADVVARQSTPGPVASPASAAGAILRSLPLGKGATRGDRWGACEFAGKPPSLDVTPVLGLLDSGTYACHVTTRSTACHVTPSQDTGPASTCSWAFHGDFAGQARLPGPVRVCEPRYAAGVLDLSFEGLGTYAVPVRLFLDDDGISADAEVELADRLVMIGLHMPYLCALVNPRLPLVTGEITVVAR